MACCAGRRAAAAAKAPPPTPPVTFEYVGRSTLRVVGAVTRRNYWFAQAGARVVVDRRDAPSVAGVPHLVQRPSPG